jgi:hypothetical protein
VSGGSKMSVEGEPNPIYDVVGYGVEAQNPMLLGRQGGVLAVLGRCMCFDVLFYAQHVQHLRREGLLFRRHTWARSTPLGLSFDASVAVAAQAVFENQLCKVGRLRCCAHSLGKNTLLTTLHMHHLQTAGLLFRRHTWARSTPLGLSFDASVAVAAQAVFENQLCKVGRPFA